MVVMLMEDDNYVDDIYDYDHYDYDDDYDDDESYVFLCFDTKMMMLYYYDDRLFRYHTRRFHLSSYPICEHHHYHYLTIIIFIDHRHHYHHHHHYLTIIIINIIIIIILNIINIIIITTSIERKDSCESLMDALTSSELFEISIDEASFRGNHTHSATREVIQPILW